MSQTRSGIDQRLSESETPRGCHVDRVTLLPIGIRTVAVEAGGAAVVVGGAVVVGAAVVEGAAIGAVVLGAAT